MNIFVLLKTAHQVYCIIRVKEGTSLTGRFQSGPIKVSRFESSKSFPTYHQLLIAFNNFHRGQLCIDHVYLLLLCISSDQLCGRYSSCSSRRTFVATTWAWRAELCSFHYRGGLVWATASRSPSPHSAKYMNI